MRGRQRRGLLRAALLATLVAGALGDEVSSTVNCASVAFSERIITTLADYARSVFAIDVDGDGDVDALSASAVDDTIAWYVGGDEPC